MIFHLVFFIVLTSVLAQGTTIPLVARWLNLTSEPKMHLIRYQNRLAEFEVCKNSIFIGTSLVDLQQNLKVPLKTSIVIIHRQGLCLLPDKQLYLEIKDRIVILSEKEQLPLFRQHLI